MADMEAREKKEFVKNVTVVLTAKLSHLSMKNKVSLRKFPMAKEACLRFDLQLNASFTGENYDVYIAAHEIMK
jgi:hypothetical protein